MKTTLLSLLCFLLAVTLYSQTETPPSPSASSLMRYEGIPVDNSTGIPQVSIPLYTLPTRSSNFSFNIGISYHASSVATFDRYSGDCGRGWTLMTGGGSIVCNEADDEWKWANFPDWPTDGRDIFNYNVNGRTGKFTRDKDMGVTILESHGGGVIITYNPTSIVISDNEGFRYVFDKRDTYITKKKLPETSDPMDPEYGKVTLTSAWHLTEVSYHNFAVLATLHYMEHSIHHPHHDSGENDKIQVLSKITSDGYGSILFTKTGPAAVEGRPHFRFLGATLYDNQVTPQPVSSFVFNYEISGEHLTSVSKGAYNGTSTETYKLFYKQGTVVFPPGMSTVPDAWGFKTLGYENCQGTVPASQFATLGVLQRMELPTGGGIVYDYESNTYSYERERPLDASWNTTTQTYDYHADYFYDLEEDFESFNSIINYDTPIIVAESLSGSNTSLTFTISSLEEGDYIFHIKGNPYVHPQLGYTSWPTFVLKKGTSTLKTFESPSYSMACSGYVRNLTQGTYTLSISGGTGTANVKKRVPVDPADYKEYWYGGGIRIKSISHYEDAAAYLANPETAVPARRVTYDYNFFDDPNRSSGALMYSQYSRWNGHFDGPIVVYKNVTVRDSEDNGRTEYEYYWPADFSDEEEVIEVDAKLRKLKSVKVYDKAGSLKKESALTYNFIETEVYGHPNHNYGRADLAQKTDKTYYDSGIYTTTHNYTYMDQGTKLTSDITTDSNGQELKTVFSYRTEPGGITAWKKDLAAVKVFRNNELMSTTKTNYLNTFPLFAGYLPSTIQSAKGDDTPETSITITNYDGYGHALEAQQEHGIKTCYVYGYHETQVIAKIEGVDYDSLNLAAVKAASDSYDEDDLLSELAILRGAVNAAGGMITTYTYKPLVGVSTVTDVRGDRLTYEYDENNRLKFVKDKDDNILSEIKYNMKPLN